MSTQDEKDPCLLISVSTSSPILSLSGDDPFIITLTAKSSIDRTLTIDTSRTILDSRSIALDYPGLTFQDLSTGELAGRQVVDVQYRVADTLTATSPSVVDLPPKHSQGAHEVDHTFMRASKTPLAGPIVPPGATNSSKAP